tara:strand:- start:353 stop:649 length:297 start_codon:yes stop_codon:yes gene_type:complete
MADPVTWMAIATTLSAEGVRKSGKAGSIQRATQEREARKAEKAQKKQQTQQLMIRQQEKKREGMTQKTPVTNNPFAAGRKDMRSQFTIGGGGDSGANY